MWRTGLLGDDPAEMDDKPILICYDATDAARRAIAAAAELLGPRRAVVLDIAPPLTAGEAAVAVSPVVPAADFEEINADEAADRARRGAERAREAGFDATARGESAAPAWEEIVAVADEIDAAVIVMGTRALSGAADFLDSSVSHQVAKHAGRPVLIVPPPQHGH
jgi:nucleotide-binding universal stress UspA family protein